MEKAKLLITPGCEAGSLYCRGCSKLSCGVFCELIPDEYGYDTILWLRQGIAKRSQQCLDAEIKNPETSNPPPVRNIQEDKFSSGELKMMVLSIVGVVACLSAILFVVYHL